MCIFHIKFTNQASQPIYNIAIDHHGTENYIMVVRTLLYWYLLPFFLVLKLLTK